MNYGFMREPKAPLYFPSYQFLIRFLLVNSHLRFHLQPKFFFCYAFLVAFNSTWILKQRRNVWLKAGKKIIQLKLGNIWLLRFKTIYARYDISSRQKNEVEGRKSRMHKHNGIWVYTIYLPVKYNISLSRPWL